jgi:hypothetical protein
MKIYHLTILGYYNNSDTTHQTSIKCDGMSYSHEGFYKFWVKIEANRYEDIAYYPIINTIITSIEKVKD